MSAPSKKRAGDAAEASSSAGRQGKRRKKAKLPNFTELAEIYGHPLFREPDGIHGPLEGIVPLKSGLTPLEPGPFSTKAELSQFEQLEAYQRTRFKGFTTDELQDFESFAPTSQETGEDNGLDSVPLHPVFGPKHWVSRELKHTAPIPLGKGREGYWEPSNPVVWDLMLPSLKIASIIISHIHTWPWWDALLAGKYERIDKSEFDEGSDADTANKSYDDGSSNDSGANIPRKDVKGKAANQSKSSSIKTGHKNNSESAPNKNPAPAKGNIEETAEDEIYYRITRRRPEIANSKKARAAVRKLFNSYCQNVRFKLFSGGEEPLTGIPMTPIYGLCSSSAYVDRTAVHVRYEALEPLLDRRISAAERLLCQWDFANTLLHESTHAFNILVAESRRPSDREPYFEDECIGELGFSMENAVWGGLSEQFVLHFGAPIAGLFRTPFLNQSNESRSQLPVLNNKPDDWLMESYYPVPIPYFSNLQNPQFWNVFIQKNGAKGVHMGPLVNGSGGDPDDGDMQKFFQSRGRRDTHMLPDITPKYGDSPRKLKYIEYENARRAQARKVLDLIDLREADRLERVKEQTEILDKKKPDDKNEKQPVGQRNSAIGPPFYRPVISTRRYNEIRDLLFRLYDDLALATMYFTISEHALLSYILAEDDFSLNPNEWRAFLIRCEKEQKFFSWKEIGYPPGITRGEVRKLDSGWPPKPRKYLVAGVDFKDPSPDLISVVFEPRTKNATNEILQAFAEDDSLGELYDFDKVLFLKWVNRRKMFINPTRFDRLISHYETKQWKNNKQDILVHGPQGIIRLLKVGWDKKGAESDSDESS